MKLSQLFLMVILNINIVNISASADKQWDSGDDSHIKSFHALMTRQGSQIINDGFNEAYAGYEMIGTPPLGAKFLIRGTAQITGGATLMLGGLIINGTQKTTAFIYNHPLETCTIAMIATSAFMEQYRKSQE